MRVLAKLSSFIGSVQALQCSTRSFQEASLVQPSQIRVLSAQKALVISFTDGQTFSLPAELLRAESHAANSRRAQKVPAGRRHVSIIGVESVGNYALHVRFDDLHSTAIFPWDFLRELGANKFARMRQYIRALRAQGGGRGPPLVPKRRAKRM